MIYDTLPIITAGVFEPLSGIFERSLHAFMTSISWVIVVIAAAIPWIALLFLLAWFLIRFLRWFLKHKRAEKAKKAESI